MTANTNSQNHPNAEDRAQDNSAQDDGACDRCAEGREDKGKLDGVVEEVGKAVHEAIVKGAAAAEDIGSGIKGAIRNARPSRDNVVMVRIDDASLERVDDLVEAGVMGSRSEAAAYLIAQGIDARQPLFDRISEKIDEIREAKEELRRLVRDEDAARASGGEGEGAADGEPVGDADAGGVADAADASPTGARQSEDAPTAR